MIGIVDYGMGNLLSVFNAFEYLGISVKICSEPEDLSQVDRIVLPGVGAINQCILKLNESGFTEALNEQVIQLAKPTLGICLGMQVMAKQSFEGGTHSCLGWFDADVIRLNPGQPNLKVPNIGWNTIQFDKQIPLFKGLPEFSDFYFVHSYQVKVHHESERVATYQHGETVTAAIMKDNIFATQFHPEKSQDLGLTMLENFINWKP
ncbi:imidazole glycerol phosphate synthase subunit HisH [Cytophagaceae bacterium 50C-KIRBA]|uniref:Imidazole glycerol phosphate synthase subunit HisH n=1 Tax=Aquirufa beregesia TaxID=2516556 RepID=A0ABX0F1P3_9BACT|nr:imidazole glycerol phosphate synthase subunit HisH [Aquirufa beregesia]NGZ43770.1 imidazole glycerol phosphate synthase subunit HisH [Aquirufa beregesia]